MLLPRMLSCIIEICTSHASLMAPVGWGGGCESQVTVSCQSIDTGAEGPKLKVSKASVYLPHMNETLHRASSVSRDDQILIPEANQAVGFVIFYIITPHF